MVGKTEVVVRPEHDPLLTVNNHDGVLRFRNRIEVRIQPDCLQLTRFRELTAFLEQRDLLKFLGRHSTSARVEVSNPHITMSRKGLN
jgi:hypothetical protein